MVIRGVAVREKLHAYALVAEIIGGIAIVISLIFLMLELRENTVAQQRATFNQLTETIDEWRNGWSLNPETRNIMSRLRNGEDVSPEEMLTVAAIRNQIYSIYERAYWGNEYGQMGASEWERFERMICAGRSTFWQDDMAFLFTTEFLNFVRFCPAD